MRSARAIVFLAALIAGGAGAQSARGAAAGARQRWRITDARVVRPARVIEAGQGRLWSGYELHANAVTLGPGPMRQAVFRLVLSAHSPARETPGRRPGRWYLRGNWTLGSSRDQAEHPTFRRPWLDARALNGELAADLDFNPLEDAGTIIGVVRREGTSAGTFSGNEKFEGWLTLGPRPDSAKGRRRSR